MPITRRTLAVVGQARDDLGASLDATSTVLVERWVRAWDALEADFARGVNELLAESQARAAATGEPPAWPSRGQVLRNRRLAEAINAAAQALDSLADATYDRTIADARSAVAAAANDHAMMLATQLPAAAGTEAALAVTFGKLDRTALDRIVARTTQQVTALTMPLSAEATSAMTTELIRGVAVGRNSGQTAVAMVRRVEGRFNGGLTRAMNISRTETLDAYRASGYEQDQANVAVLRGWRWLAKLDGLTCPSCFAQHGSLHPVQDPGPLDHQQGRCARAPETKTWRELGFDLDDPPSVIPDARAAYDALSPAEQLAVMGPSRRDALADGRITFADLSTRRSTSGWRDSYAPTTVRDLLSPTTR